MQQLFSIFGRMPKKRPCNGFTTDGCTYMSWYFETEGKSAGKRMIDLAAVDRGMFDEQKVFIEDADSIRNVGVDAGCDILLCLWDSASGRRLMYRKGWYHRQNKVAKRRRQRNRWQHEADAATQAAFAAASEFSLRQWSFAIFQHNWSQLVIHVPQLFAFYGAIRFNKQRWACFILHQRTNARLVKDVKDWLTRVGGDDDRKVVLAYGNAKFKTSWRGQLSGPRTKLQNVLGHHFAIVRCPEYRSTKLCSTCHSELVPSHHPSQANHIRRNRRYTVYRS